MQPEHSGRSCPKLSVAMYILIVSSRWWGGVHTGNACSCAVPSSEHYTVIATSNISALQIFACLMLPFPRTKLLFVWQSAKQLRSTESAEKSGLGGCEMEVLREGWRGSSLSYVSSNASYFYSSLYESITISRIWFWNSRQARFIRETSRCIEENCSVATG